MNFKFFDAPATDQRITGRIVSSILPGWWIVADDQGRKYRAASSGMYRSGDRVAVVGGQIVDVAGKAAAPAVYQV